MSAPSPKTSPSITPRHMAQARLTIRFAFMESMVAGARRQVAYRWVTDASQETEAAGIEAGREDVVDRRKVRSAVEARHGGKRSHDVVRRDAGAASRSLRSMLTAR